MKEWKKKHNKILKKNKQKKSMNIIRYINQIRWKIMLSITKCEDQFICMSLSVFNWNIFNPKNKLWFIKEYKTWTCAMTFIDLLFLGTLQFKMDSDTNLVSGSMKWEDKEWVRIFKMIWLHVWNFQLARISLQIPNNQFTRSRMFKQMIGWFKSNFWSFSSLDVNLTYILVKSEFILTKRCEKV